MIDKMVLHSRQHLGCLCRILDYLDCCTLRLAYKAITLCHVDFVPLQCRRRAAAVGLLLNLLDCHCREILQTFCLNFFTPNVTLHRSSRLVTPIQPKKKAGKCIACRGAFHASLCLECYLSC